MASYHLSPYVHFIENRLVPTAIHYGIVHRLTGEVTKPSQQLRSLLLALKLGHRSSLSEQELALIEAQPQVKRLIEKEFLIHENNDPLHSFLDYRVVRPIQNPALSFRSSPQDIIIVRTSLEHFVFSPAPDELPPIFEEVLPPGAAEIFLRADGTRTLRAISEELLASDEPIAANVQSIKHAIDFLTSQDRQLIKLALPGEDLTRPYKPFNSVPRNLSHSLKWNSGNDHEEGIRSFHQHGIADASWEFDWIEPTLNHAFRFPSEVLGGLDFASRFCMATLVPDVVPALRNRAPLEVLEVGGGTGSFALAFLRQVAVLKRNTPGAVELNYHIVELSPTLMESQRSLLSALKTPVTHFQQDATKLDLAGHKFQLIIANEVIADFPTSPVWRVQPILAHGEIDAVTSRPQWEGDGAAYISKYNILAAKAPDAFQINAGVFEFVERAWDHLVPGGTLILSEYGGEDYPRRQNHLNHEEYSIHFGHVMACASHVGFTCRLLTLKEFLGMDDEILMLNGSAEHILCLNHVLRKFGMSLPYAAISKKEFEERFKRIADEISLIGVSFSPLKSGFHYGPDVNQFKVVILHKPKVQD